MRTIDLLGYKKVAILSLSGLLFILLRWQTLSAAAWTNLGMTAVNQYPLWQSIVKDIGEVEGPGIQRAIERNPGDEALWRAWGMLHFARGDEREALATWTGIGLVPAAVAIHQGRYAQSVGSIDIAVAWYEYGVQRDPERADAWHQLGMLYQEQGHTEAAIAAYQRSRALGYAESVDPLATLWRENGDHQASIDVWKAALQSFSADPARLDWWRGLCNGLRATEEWDRALVETHDALSEFPDDPRLHVERGFALFYGAKDSSKAMKEFLQAIALDENMAMAYAGLGELLAAEENYEQAIYWYGLAIEREADDPSWHLARADSALAKGDLANSLRWFEETIDRWPDLPYAYFRIALVFRQLEQMEDAVNAIEQAIELMDEPNPHYFFRAAVIYEQIGDNERALGAYETVLMLEPDNEAAKRAVERLTN